MAQIVLVRGKTYMLKKDKSVVEFEFVNERTGQAMIHPLGEYDMGKWFGVHPDELEVYSSASVRNAQTST